MITRDGLPGVREWLAAFAATSSATIISSLTIATVITLSGGAPQFRKLPEMIQFGLMVALANTSLALLAVGALWLSPAMLWLLILPLVMVFLAYRASVGAREARTTRAPVPVVRILQHSPELEFDPRRAAEPRAHDVPGRARGSRPVPAIAGEDALRTRSWHERRAEVMVPDREHLDDPIHDRIRRSTVPFFGETQGPDRRDPRQWSARCAGSPGSSAR